MTQSLEAPERKRKVMVSIAVGVDVVFEAAQRQGASPRRGEAISMKG